MLKIAHRGYSDVYGDNNMNSFQKAYEEGFDVIEMDIQLNKANELVIHHDLYKNGLFVSEMTHQQTRDNSILFLKDVFEEFRYTNIILYLDLKGPEGVSDVLIKYIFQSDFPKNRLWVASFNKNHLYTFMCSPLKIALGFITSNNFYPHEIESILYDIDFVVCDINILSKSYLDNLKELKKGIFVYTGSNSFEIEYFKKFNVDGIISNILF